MKARLMIIGILVGVFTLLGPAVSVYAAEFAHPEYLVETNDLAAKLGEPNLVVVDVRKAEDYADGHVKGAISLPIGLTKGTVKDVKEMMLPTEKLEELLGSKGISPDSYVVIYDEDLGEPASRLFWTLDVLGHKKMSILNGGSTKWAKEGKPLSTEATVLPPAKYAAKPDVSKVATIEEVKEVVGKKKQAVLLDNRSEKEYTGEVPSREVTRAGHIPDAIGIDWVNNLATKGGFKVLKSADELVPQYEKQGVTKDKEIIVYCRTGSRSSNTYFVLKLLGYPKVKNYDGSMMEWGNIADLPLVKK
jgi:thiosulfate/3-mercaptopyruvate sulfurtransferase